MVNSRRKGKVGELEAAKWWRDNFEIEARRGQQFCGSPDSPDIVISIDGIHVECKRVERTLNLHEIMKKALLDSGDKKPLCFHRKNREDWLITIYANDLIKICEIIYNATEKLR